MEVLYQSTRSTADKVTASQAILKGLAEDGGLFVPDHLPAFDHTFAEFAEMSYQETAYHVMKLFFSDFTEAELKDCIRKAYDTGFDTEEIAPLAEADGSYYLELFHGRTIAFKDMALSILPHLMITSAKKNQVQNEIVILTATSGDTGKAALAGFADVPGTRIIVFYPKDGVSPIQEKQMVTQTGGNVLVAAIRGNFDQAQTGVKAMFHDKGMEQELAAAGFQFSSANSINIGRLVPQIVYYVYAYAKLLQNEVIARDEQINVAVPTGNFGNILAAFYAKQMGLPIKTLLCASNSNKVLYDFFETGHYDKNRPFYVTSSPSMDILVSSNLERLLYWLVGQEGVASCMEKLSGAGAYEIENEVFDRLPYLKSGFATEEETAAEIRLVYENASYVIDPHTAVASKVVRKYKKETGDVTKTVIASTASPFKFTRSVMNALGEDKPEADDFALADALAKLSNRELPQAVSDIRNAPVLHDTVCDPEEMPEVVRGFLK
ncbi:MAG: threonine synthase [Lachnospiraceae bacterium]|nr:threonine synthase [Lachnospiraceae bacterium]